jgi:hypothetical protein
MVSETFSDVFPSPHPGARQSFAHLQLARGIMRRHRALFGVGDEAGFDVLRRSEAPGDLPCRTLPSSARHR